MKTRIEQPTATPRRSEIENDISKNSRSRPILLTRQQPVCAAGLEKQMKPAHRNAGNPQLIGLFELFDQIEKTIESYVDLMVDRVVRPGDMVKVPARTAAVRSRMEK